MLFERFVVVERACSRAQLPCSHQHTPLPASTQHQRAMLCSWLRPAEQQQLVAAHLTEMVLCGLMAADKAAGEGGQRQSFTLGKMCMRMQRRQAQRRVGGSAAPARKLHCAIVQMHTCMGVHLVLLSSRHLHVDRNRVQQRLVAGSMTPQTVVGGRQLRRQRAAIAPCNDCVHSPPYTCLELNLLDLL